MPHHFHNRSGKRIRDGILKMNQSLRVRIGKSALSNETSAIRDVFEQIQQDDMHTVLFFCSTRFNLDDLEIAIKNTFHCNVVGCTTAGEITRYGYSTNSIVAASIAGSDLQIHSCLIDTLDQLNTDASNTRFLEIQTEIQTEVSSFEPQFGLLLIDGLSMQEENLTAALYQFFGKIPIIGGSAGDDLKFLNTYVYFEGRFIPNAAVINFFYTDLPFHIFKIQHFQPSTTRLVITGSDPSRRCVTEINGEPAASEYAALLGISVSDLSPSVFSNHPVMLKIGGDYYVRSIQKANEDGSLTFFCAIDDGLVLTIAEGVDMIRNLDETIHEIEKKIPEPGLIIGCDCILRRLEMQQKGMTEDIASLLSRHPFIGFSTYGEQFNAIHVNQTLTGIVIGKEKE